MPRIAFMIMLGLCVALAGAQPAAAADQSALSPAQKEEIKKLIRSYILENPEILPEAIEILQAKQEKAKGAKRADVLASRKEELFNPPEGTVIANPNGDVTLVEFFDYNCGYCKHFFPTLMEVAKADPKLRVVMKEYPILGPSSAVASQAALAAMKQGKYTAFHFALLGYKGQLSNDAIMKVALETGLDLPKLREDMRAPEITAILKKNHELAQAFGIDGTPAMFIGDEFVPGAIEKEDLLKMIADARKK